MTDLELNSSDDFTLEILKALSNNTRLSILAMTANIELSQKYLSASLDVSEAAISQHVARLKETDLITMRRSIDGRKYIKSTNTQIRLNIVPLAPNASWGDICKENVRTK